MKRQSTGKPTMRALVHDAQERVVREEAVQAFVKASPRRRLEMWTLAVARAAADELREPPADDEVPL
jgi:hypothetical protein